MRREFSAKIKEEAFARSSGRCEVCNGQLKPGQFQFHHRVPAWKGGDNSIANIICACTSCHLAAEQEHDFDNMRRADRKAKIKKQLPVASGVPEIARRFGVSHD